MLTGRNSTYLAKIIAFGRTLENTNCRNYQRKTSSVMATIEQVIESNKRNGAILTSIQDELIVMRSEMIARKKCELVVENAALAKQVEAAIAQLIALELRNGKTQIPVAGKRGLCTQTPQQNVQEVKETANSNPKEQPPLAKEKKPKKEKSTTSASGAAAAAENIPVDVGRLDMRVGKIVEVGRHPDADSLYLEKIDCGEPQPRTVVSGLVKFIPLEEMQNRMVVVLCNLKPAKMRGVTSEAMVMCASTPEKVEVLSPPAGAVPGDFVHCEGYTRQPDAQLNPKKKIFETCAPDLKTNEDLVACYKNAALHVPGKGKIIAQTLKNVQVK